MEEYVKQNEKYTTMRDYLQVIFRQKSIVIFTVIFSVLATAIGLQFNTTTYESRVKMLSLAKKFVDSPFYKDISEFDAASITLTQSEIVKSDPVLERVVKELRLGESLPNEERKYASNLKNLFLDLSDYLKERKSKYFSEERKQQYNYYSTLEELKDRIKVKQIKSTGIFIISVTDYNPQNAEKIANVISRSYCIFDLEQQLAELQQKYGEKHLSIMQLKDNIKRMENDLGGEEVSSIEAFGPASVKVVEQASYPMEPVGFPKAATLALSLMLGLFLGIILAFSFESMDTTLKSPLEIKDVLGLNLLGFVPRLKPLFTRVCLVLKTVLNLFVSALVLGLVLRLLANFKIFSPANPLVISINGITDPSVSLFGGVLPFGGVEGFDMRALAAIVAVIILSILLNILLSFLENLSVKKQLILNSLSKNSRLLHVYQNLSDQIYISLRDNGQKAVLFLSLLPKEGVSSIVANLGVYLSGKSGQKILLIDANLRKPRLHKIFNASNDWGFVDILSGIKKPDELIQHIRPHLYLLPAGNMSFEVGALFSSEKLSDIIKEVEGKYGLVLIDCADLKSFKDSLAIASCVDTLCLVVGEGRVRREVAKTIIAPLLRKKTNFLGAILNRRTFAIPKIVYERM